MPSRGPHPPRTRVRVWFGLYFGTTMDAEIFADGSMTLDPSRSLFKLSDHIIRIPSDVWHKHLLIKDELEECHRLLDEFLKELRHPS